MWREQEYDKNNLDLLASTIHLKSQNLSYLNSWLVLVVVFLYVCLCVCVFVFVCLFVYEIVCLCVDFTLIISLC